MEWIISPLIMIVGIVVVSIGVKASMSYLEARRRGEGIRLAIVYSEVIVRALEGTGGIKGLDGQGKKERAIMDLTTFAEKNGIGIERTEIDAIIESMVQKI